MLDWCINFIFSNFMMQRYISVDCPLTTANFLIRILHHLPRKLPKIVSCDNNKILFETFHPPLYSNWNIEDPESS